MQYSALAVAALASLVTAQTNGPTTVHVVAVGMNGTNTFSPNSLKANPGDMVQFQFWTANHTITQSTFDAPCQPIGAHSNVTGFHSGFQPVAASQAMGMIPTFSVMITDNKPIWGYCAQLKHCEQGMVMVINENTASNKTLAAYKDAAAKVASTVIPSGTNTTTGGTTGTTQSPGGSSSSSGTTTTSSAMDLATPGAVGLLAVVAAFFML